MGKPTLPRWSTNALTTREPPEGKKDTGWVPKEKPPYQYFNWLHNSSYLYDIYNTARNDLNQPTIIVNQDGILWNGTTIAFTDDLIFFFREQEDVFFNSIDAADSPLTIGANQYLVVRLDRTQTTTLTFQTTYANLADGEYTIVDEANLLAANEEYELLVFRGNGTDLTYMPENIGIAPGELFQADKRHFVTKDGLRAFEGKVQGVSTVGGDAGETLTTKDYVDSVAISDHGNLTGLNDPNDHTWASLVDGSRAFTAVVGGVTPTASSHLATKGYVDSRKIGVTGLGDTWDVSAPAIASIGYYQNRTEMEWLMSRDGDNASSPKRIYFQAVSGDWELFKATTGTGNLKVLDDDTGGITMDITGAPVFVSGTEWYYEVSTVSDISAYTTAQNARFVHGGLMIFKARAGGTQEPTNPFASRFRIYFDQNTSGGAATYTVTLFVDGTASDDIVTSAWVGFRKMDGQVDDDNEFFIGRGNWNAGSGQWSFDITMRGAANDGCRYDVEFTVIPRTIE